MNIDAQDIINALVVVLLITQLLDWYTTRTILRNGGYEQNPVTKKGIELLGVDPFLGIKAVAVTGLGFYIGNVFVLGGLVTVYVFVLVHNWRSMP